MAFSTPVNIASRFDQANTSTLVLPASGTLDLHAGRLYIMFVSAARSTTAPDFSSGFTFTHSGTGKTWTYIDQTASIGSSSPLRLAAYSYIPPSDELGITITFDPAGGADAHNKGCLIEIGSGFDATTPIAQHAVNTAATGTSLSVALGSAPAGTSLSLSSFVTYNGATSAIDPDGSFTELSDDQGTSTGSDSGSIESQYKDPATTTASASVTATNRNWAGIHLEIAAASGGSGITVSPDVGAVTITGFEPTIGLPVTITPGVGAVTLTGFAPTIGLPITVLPGVGSVVITGFAPTLGLPVTVLPGLGSVVLTGFAPTLGLPVTILPGVGAVLLTGFEPTIDFGGVVVAVMVLRKGGD